MMKAVARKGKKTKKAIWIITGVTVLAAAAFTALAFMGRTNKTSASAAEHKTAIAQKRTITAELSSSGTISPKDTYSITSLVEGEVIEADFEEGDQVSEGQVLYRIDSSTMESELNTAVSALNRAQSSYELAVSDYQDAAGKYSGNTYKSTTTGYIKQLYISDGDKVSSNTKLADLYSEQVMKIRVPFLSVEAAAMTEGMQAIITLTDTQEQLSGVVTGIADMEETLSGGRIVRYITVEVANPGGLTVDHTAVVSVGEFACNVEGAFAPSIDKEMNANLDSGVDIAKVLVKEGDYVTVGTPLFTIEAKSAEKMIRTFKDSMDKAEESLESAKNKVENAQDDLENYSITAPISGQVITKSIKAGDTISRGSSGSTTLAVIYDLSGATFEMSVDELDVQNVKVGQAVEVTADAFENKIFSGTVTNISLESVASNGVTNYPVTVTLDEVGKLLPGMNVDARIILDQAQDALTIPVDSLLRGNQVYIKDETVSQAQGNVPAGFRSVEVETGLMNDDYVQILSGLSEGDEVYVAESSVNNNQMITMPGGMPGGGMPGGGMPGGDRGGNGGSRGGMPGSGMR